MIKMYRAAVGAGYRAGMAPRPVIVHEDGTKTIAQPTCPYVGRWQGLLRMWYWDGYHQGRMESHRRWISGRRVAV